MSTDHPTAQAAQDADRVAVDEALASEAELAARAAEIRTGEAMEPALLAKLLPLLAEPIPQAFIKFVPVVTGKPYESTGVRSLQVQVDRMNNVLTPACWWVEANYEDEGMICHVRVYVGTYPMAIAMRQGSGGVNRGSTKGNVFKGSYTNAAKRVIAEFGPGHEVYLGAAGADLDPDVNAEVAAGQQAALDTGEGGPPIIGKPFAKKMVDRAWEVPAAKRQLQLAASHAAERDVGDCATKAKATEALSALTFPEAERLDNWIVKKTEEEAA